MKHKFEATSPYAVLPVKRNALALQIRKVLGNCVDYVADYIISCPVMDLKGQIERDYGVLDQ